MTVALDRSSTERRLKTPGPLDFNPHHNATIWRSSMKEDYRSERGDPGFWKNLGLAEHAANSAALCFPEG